MSFVNTNYHTRVGALWLSTVVFVATGCGWKSRMTFKSPDKVYEIQILEKEFLTDSRIQILLGYKSSVTTIYTDSHDWGLGLTEVYWSSDGTLVGICVCNVNEGPLVFAYNLKRKMPADMNLVKDELRRIIRLKYQLHDGEDPLSWACSNEGTAAFSSKSSLR